MPFKHTLIFNVQSVQADTNGIIRQGSFSESYLNPDSFDKDRLNKFITNRMALASDRVTCVALRVVDTTTKNVMNLQKFVAKGLWGASGEGDFPSAAAFCTGVGSRNGVHKLELRGLPDAASTAGAGIGGLADLNRRAKPFFDGLKNNGWYQLARNLGATAQKIVSVEPVIGSLINAAVVTTNLPLAMAVGSSVWILRTRSRSGNRSVRGGKFICTVATVGNSFTIAEWNGGSCMGGRARIDDPQNNEYRDLTVQEVNLRKVGSPFFKFRGRRQIA